jgi:hypothetical protein
MVSAWAWCWSIYAASRSRWNNCGVATLKANLGNLGSRKREDTMPAKDATCSCCGYFRPIRYLHQGDDGSWRCSDQSMCGERQAKRPLGDFALPERREAGKPTMVEDLL